MMTQMFHYITATAQAATAVKTAKVCFYSINCLSGLAMLCCLKDYFFRLDKW